MARWKIQSEIIFDQDDFESMKILGKTPLESIVDKSDFSAFS